MSGFAQPWTPGFDPATGALVLPLWSAAIIAATMAAFCVFLLVRASRDGIPDAVARGGLLLSGAALAWIIVGDTSSGRFATDRRALDARWLEMTTRAATPGSALSCLDATAGDVVEAACEKALFATPEATAASVAYVTAQLLLLADGSAYERSSGANYEAVLGALRHAVEADRFGIAAHVLTDREGCRPDRCDAFSYLRDTNQVSENMNEHKFESFVRHYAPGWPQPALSSVAANSALPAPAPASEAIAPVQNSVATATAKSPPNNLYFPSSASIPPVSIMDAEPTAPQSQGPPADAPPKPAARKPTPSATPSAQQAHRPASLAPPGQAGVQ